jgi:hypothetical protein
VNVAFVLVVGSMTALRFDDTSAGSVSRGIRYVAGASGNQAYPPAVTAHLGMSSGAHVRGRRGERSRLAPKPPPRHKVALELESRAADRGKGSDGEDLLGQGTIDASTRFVLVNPAYFNAAWAEELQSTTMSFARADGEARDRLTSSGNIRWAQTDDAELVAVPYEGRKSPKVSWWTSRTSSSSGTSRRTPCCSRGESSRRRTPTDRVAAREEHR